MTNTTLADDSGLRFSGTVKIWHERGYGFIKPDDGTPDIFFHASAIQAAGLREPERGDRFSFAIVTDSRSGKPRASDLEPE